MKNGRLYPDSSQERDRRSTEKSDQITKRANGIDLLPRCYEASWPSKVERRRPFENDEIENLDSSKA